MCRRAEIGRRKTGVKGDLLRHRPLGVCLAARASSGLYAINHAAMGDGAPVAQRIEHQTSNLGVARSSRAGRTILPSQPLRGFSRPHSEALISRRTRSHPIAFVDSDRDRLDSPNKYVLRFEGGLCGTRSTVTTSLPGCVHRCSRVAGMPFAGSNVICGLISITASGSSVNLYRCPTVARMIAASISAKSAPTQMRCPPPKG